MTVAFWAVKVLTTGMGESTSDFLVHKFPPVLAVIAGAIAFAAALFVQFRASRYVVWIYWTCVVMVAVFGTMCADVLHVGFGVPYAVSTAFFAVALAAVFFTWHRVEGTLSIHSIVTPRREVFYWLAVVTTFALGTAAGDLTARTVGLGYLGSGFMFVAAICVPALAYWRLGLNPVLGFWTAYVITRPVGASFADWVAVPSTRGGLGWGTGPVSLVLLVAILVGVAWLARTRADVQEAAAAADPALESA